MIQSTHVTKSTACKRFVLPAPGAVWCVRGSGGWWERHWEAPHARCARVLRVLVVVCSAPESTIGLRSNNIWDKIGTPPGLVPSTNLVPPSTDLVSSTKIWCTTINRQSVPETDCIEASIVTTPVSDCVDPTRDHRCVEEEDKKELQSEQPCFEHLPKEEQEVVSYKIWPGKKS